ncbi:MAG: metallopeptidase TldD-related protein [Nocardioides sp.]|nr:metallopeptidase TldD-related protein [Nocardioides sp.]
MPRTPQQLVEHALATTRADQCVVVLRDSTRANLRWAGNTLTTNGVMHDVVLTVVSFVGDRSASVTGSAVTAKQVDALVAAADAHATTAPRAGDAAPLVEGGQGPDWDEAPVPTSIGVYDALAPALGDVFERAQSEGRLLYGFVDHDMTTTYVGSSTGLRLRHVQPTGHYGITGKDTTLTRSAWVGGATRDFADVDVTALDAELSQRLSWAERTIEIPAGRYDTVLPPTAVADLTLYAYRRAGARVAHDGQSVYSRPGGGTRIGDRIARPGVHLHSDPSRPGLEAQPFVTATSSGPESSVFDTGLPLGPTDWIRDGNLTSLLQTRASAALTDQPATPVVDNLVLDVAGGAGTTEDLVAGVDRGLLVTCLWYIREVDPQTLLLTGLTRDGVYAIEDGEVVGAVSNFRFNESPVDLLRRFTHASAAGPTFSREWGDEFSRTEMPALRVPDFNMSSRSLAR